jgi:sec-independent protein translocase protein TatA
MFEGLFQPMHLVVILGIALLVFGPRRLPELGRGLGEAILGFKSSFNGGGATPASPTSQDEDTSRTKQLRRAASEKSVSS